MVSITLSVPEDVKHKMEHFSEINWSGFVRKAIIEKTSYLEWKEKLKMQLVEDEEITHWSRELTRKTRKARIEELRKKGLLS